MLAQITEALVSLFFLGLIAVMGLAFLSTLFGFPFLWWSWTPRREERSERVIIINNTPPAPAQSSAGPAFLMLASAAAALLVALTRRVEQPALPQPTDRQPLTTDEWYEVAPGQWVKTRQPADIHPTRYYGN